MEGTTVLRVAYDGAPFAGFARQPGLPTVQGTLEDALRVSLRRDVLTVGAGRTDTGVHALRQAVSFPSAPTDPEPFALLRSLGALAAPSVVVREVLAGPAGFSARHDALGRVYVYRLVTGPVRPVFLDGRAWWVKGDLDLDAMRASSAAVIGRHDFRSYCAAESADRGSTMREIDELTIVRAEHLGEECVEVRIAGRSFLHSMVRILVGTLVEVGRGRWDPGWTGRALDARERASAGPTAPPEGLVLWDVRYPEGVLRQLAP